MALMNDFFKVTDDEIKNAENDGKFVPIHNQQNDYQIVEIMEKKGKVDMAGNEYDMMILKTIELKSSLEFTVFVSNNRSRDIKVWISILKSFFSDEQIRNGVPRTSLISKTFTATGDVNEYNGKTYYNLKNIKECDSTPDLKVEVSSTTDIPF